jgi:hypothetical protein
LKIELLPRLILLYRFNRNPDKPDDEPLTGLNLERFLLLEEKLVERPFFGKEVEEPFGLLDGLEVRGGEDYHFHLV